MSIFVFNPFRVGEELTPPQLRRPRMTAFIRVLMRPIQYLSDVWFDEYFKGASYADYDNATAYVIYDRVVWKDNGVYELRVTTSTGEPHTGNALSSTNWRKLMDSFIGVDERVTYNGQIIILEEAINKHFRITANPYIYFEPVILGAYQNFINVKVPLAVYTTLGSNNTARNNRVKAFLRQYTLANLTLNITSY